MDSVALDSSRNSEPLISSQIIRCYIEFLERFHPEADTAQLLANAGIERYQLEDRGDWVSLDQVKRFHQGLSRSFDDCSLSREVGRYLVGSRTAGIFRRYALRFLSLRALYLHVPAMFAKWTRSHCYTARALEDGRLELTAAVQPGCSEQACQCANRTGVLEAIPELFTGQLGQIEHPSCMHRGDDCCRYLLSWSQPEPGQRRLRRGGLLLASLASVALAYALFGCVGLASAALGLLLGGTLWTLVERTRQRDRLQQTIQRLSHDGEETLEAIRFSYNSSQLILELGQAYASASALEEREIWQTLLEAIDRRLEYPQGFVLSPCADGATLRFVQGYGLSAAQQQVLAQTAFPLSAAAPPPWIQCALRRQPIWAQAEHAPPALDPALAELPLASFSCLPLAHQGELLAVLALATGPEPTASERNLLYGMATQAGLSLVSSRSYRRLQQREKQYRFLAENVSDVIWTMDLQSLRLTYVSPSSLQQQGYTPEELLELSLEQYLAPRSYEQARERIARLVQEDPGEQLPVVLELEYVRKDGSLLPIEVTINILRDDAARPILLAGVTRDISERKKVEKERSQLEAALWQAHKLEAIGTFAAGIAHDFSNILAVVMGHAEVVRLRLGASSPLQEDLAGVLDAAHRGRDLVRQIMTFGRPVQQPEPLDLETTINATLPLVRALLPAGVQLEVRLQPTGEIQGTATQIQQLLVNLCANAGEACAGEGTVTVSLSAVEVDPALAAQHPELRADAYARLQVGDNGKGIEPQQLAAIFDPFFTTREGGTGLGLPLVKNIVSSMQGAIAVRSEPGQGSTFEIYLPCRAAAAPLAAGTTPATTATELSTPPPRPPGSGG